jgi:hypothetical protein
MITSARTCADVPVINSCPSAPGLVPHSQDTHSTQQRIAYRTPVLHPACCLWGVPSRGVTVSQHANRNSYSYRQVAYRQAAMPCYGLPAGTPTQSWASSDTSRQRVHDAHALRQKVELENSSTGRWLSRCSTKTDKLGARPSMIDWILPLEAAGGCDGPDVVLHEQRQL